MKTQLSRGAFVKQGALWAGGAAGTMFLASCSSSVRGLVPMTATPAQKIKFSVKSNPKSSGIFPATIEENNGDGSGDLGWDPNAQTLTGSFTTNAGDTAFSANYVESDSSQTVSAQISGPTVQGSRAVTWPVTTVTTATPYTAAYSDGGNLQYTVVDSQNVTGTITGPDGSTWTASLYMTDTQSTFTWDGPTSGSLTCTINADGTVTPSSSGIHPMDCGGGKEGKTTLDKLAATFTIAAIPVGIFTGGIGAAVCVGIAGGIAVYRGFACN